MQHYGSVVRVELVFLCLAKWKWACTFQGSVQHYASVVGVKATFLFLGNSEMGRYFSSSMGHHTHTHTHTITSNSEKCKIMLLKNFFLAYRVVSCQFSSKTCLVLKTNLHQHNSHTLKDYWQKWSNCNYNFGYEIIVLDIAIMNIHDLHLLFGHTHNPGFKNIKIKINK